MSSNIGPASATTKFISELALKLHNESAARPKLRSEPSPDESFSGVDLPIGCRLVEGAIEFESLTVRNAIVAEVTYGRLNISSNIDSDELFKHAYDLWRHEIGHDDQAAGRLLALASEKIDVLVTGAQRIRSGANAFDVLHLIQAALPYLSNIEVPSIIDLVSAKHEPTKSDLMAGEINAALEKWLEKRSATARELHAKVLENLSESTSSLLSNAIVALSKSDYITAFGMAKEDAQSETLMRAEIGAWTLGRLLLDDQAESEAVHAVAEAVVTLIESEQCDIRSQAIRAAVGAMHKMPTSDAPLQRLADSGDQVVLCAAATALLHQGDAICERGIIQYWLKVLPALRPESEGAIQSLDYALSRLLSDSRYTSLVVAALSEWVAKHGRQFSNNSGTVDLFQSTIQALLALDATWSLLVTDWLLSEQKEHAIALAGILTQFSAARKSRFHLDKNRLDKLSSDDVLFLARRMLGYVHDREQLTSLALSMLESSDAEERIYPVLGTLLVDEIGYDYPDSTVKTLRKAMEDQYSTSHHEFLQRVVDGIEQIVEAQNSLPTINELQPSTKLRRLFRLARAKQMNNSLEEASKKSIWRQIATTIPVKAGGGTFSY